MRGYAAGLAAVLAMPLPLAAQVGWEDKVLAIGRYHWSLPVGDTKEYTDNTSWIGFAIEGRRFIAQDLSTSLLVGWTEFSERTDDPILLAPAVPDSTVTGDQDRTLRILPFLLGGQRYFGRPGGAQPYVGLSFGAYWIRQELGSGSGNTRAENVSFGVAPEVGLAIPLRPEVAMIVGTRYDIPFSGGDFFGGAQSFRHWSLGIGIAYVP